MVTERLPNEYLIVLRIRFEKPENTNILKKFGHLIFKNKTGDRIGDLKNDRSC